MIWIASAVSVLAGVAAARLALRQRSRLSLPVSSSRVRLQARIVLAVAAAAALTLLIVLVETPRSVARNVDLGSGASMIVIDLSGSIDNFEMNMIGKTLHALAQNPDRRVGLVFFSDSAVEVLPPETPASELEKISRFFVRTKVIIPPAPTPAAPIVSTLSPPSGASSTPPLETPPNPWQRAFDGGTAIARGLSVARRALEQVHAAKNGQIIVISDLQDAGTWMQKVELMRDVRAGIDVKVVFVGYDPSYEALWRSFYGPKMFLKNPQVLAVKRSDHLTNSHVSLLVPALISLLILLAAALEVLCGRLELRG